MKIPTSNISINDIMARYNQAFGYTSMKLLARFLKLPTFNNASSDFAEMSFINNITGDSYRFGIDQLPQGIPALPFQTIKPTIKKYIAPPPMVSFSRDKHVVITPIDRSNNVVIENFGNKSYEIQLQGIMVDVENHQYPGELLSTIHEMFEAPGTYRVVGDIFYDLNISEIFFKSGFNVSFVEGYVDTIKFSVRAISVEPAEFTMS